MELRIRSGETRKTAFKWNVTYLKGEFSSKIKEKWEGLPANAIFFFKLRHISRLYRQLSKNKAKEHKRIELNARANLEVATAKLHDDIYNEELQGVTNMHKRTLEEIETRKTRGPPLGPESNGKRWEISVRKNSSSL